MCFDRALRAFFVSLSPSPSIRYTNRTMPSLKHYHNNPEFIHHKNPKISATMRELVFGMEDGMVSTFGAITGIAGAIQDHFVIVLAGLVVVGVESISMAVGSYLSTKSERAIDERKLDEERMELHAYPKEERKELANMYVADGWDKKLAAQMAEQASQNHELFLKEMAYRELKVFPDMEHQPKYNAAVMGISYIFGGAIPLIPYLLVADIQTAFIASLIITPIGLLSLGAFVTKFSKQSWIKVGIEMATLGGFAAVVGYLVGQISNVLLK